MVLFLADFKVFFFFFISVLLYIYTFLIIVLGSYPIFLNLLVSRDFELFCSLMYQSKCWPLPVSNLFATYFVSFVVHLPSCGSLLHRLMLKLDAADYSNVGVMPYVKPQSCPVSVPYLFSTTLEFCSLVQFSNRKIE